MEYNFYQDMWNWSHHEENWADFAPESCASNVPGQATIFYCEECSSGLTLCKDHDWDFLI